MGVPALWLFPALPCANAAATCASGVGESPLGAVPNGTRVLESMRLSISFLGCAPASPRNWLSHFTPVRVGHLEAACSCSARQQSRTCLSRSRGLAESSSIVFVSAPYFAISIYVCKTHDHGAAVRTMAPTTL